MVGKDELGEVGVSVSGRAAVSATQPDSAPVMANGFL